MVYEGVNFFDDAVRGMDRDRFIEEHKGIFWQDRDEAVRTRMLGEAYDLIAGKPKREKKTEE